MILSLSKGGEHLDSLSFEKIWEDVGFYELRVIAQADDVSASTAVYVAPDAVKELSYQLREFPHMQDDNFIWETGTKGISSSPCISLEFWCKDRSGDVQVEVYLELEDHQERNYHCYFAMKLEPGQLNKFGQELLKLNNPGIGMKVKI